MKAYPVEFFTNLIPQSLPITETLGIGIFEDSHDSRKHALFCQIHGNLDYIFKNSCS